MSDALERIKAIKERERAAMTVTPAATTRVDRPAPAPQSGGSALDRIRSRRMEIQRGNSDDPIATAVKQDPGRGSLLDPLSQGVTLGWGDEIGGVAAGIGALFTDETAGDAYRRERDRQRANYEAYKARNPWTSMGAEVVGSLPTMFVPGLNAARGVTALGGAARMAGAGAVGGGIMGAGQGGDSGGTVADALRDRLASGAVGAGIGAATGGGLSLAGSGAKRLGTAAMQHIRPNAATKMGITPGAQRRIGQIVEADDETLGAIQQRARDFGDDAMIADTSPGLQRSADVLMADNRPGANQFLRRPLDARSEGRLDAASNAVDDVLGPEPNVAAELDRLDLTRRTNADRLAKAAVEENEGRGVALDGVMDLFRRDLGADSLEAIRKGGTPAVRDLPEEQAIRKVALRLMRESPEAGGDFAGFSGGGERHLTLSQFLRQRGFDPAMGDRAEIETLVGTKAGRGRGLWKRGGYQSSDEAAEAAAEAGYLHNYDRRELLDALDEDFRGGGVYRFGEGPGSPGFEGGRAKAPKQTRAMEMASDFERVRRAQQMVSKDIRQAKSSNDGNLVAALSEYEDALNRALEYASNDVHAAFRAQYANDKGALEAFDEGAKMITSLQDVSLLRKHLSGLSPEQTEAFRMGARDRVRQLLTGSTTGDLTVMKKLAQPRNQLHKALREVVGDEQAERIAKRAQGELRKRATEAKGKGSDTAARRGHPEAKRDLGLDSQASLYGDVKATGRRALRAIAPDLTAGRARSMSRVLGAQGAERDKIIEALIASQPGEFARNADLAAGMAGRTLGGAFARTNEPGDTYAGTRVTVRPLSPAERRRRDQQR